MKGLTRLLVVIGLVIGLAWPAQAYADEVQVSACTHYVDSSASTDGNGLATQPWKNIGSSVGKLTAGNVLCVRGDTSGAGRVYLTGTLVLSKSGTASAPITLRPFPGEKVILRNNTEGHLLHFNGNVAYWIVDGLSFDNDNRTGRAILLAPGAHHNTLRNNEIYNGQTDGIVVSKDARDNVIENNHIHHFIHPNPPIDAHCILVQIRADNTLIRRNTIHDCSGAGIHILETGFSSSADYADNVRIIANTFYRGTLPRAESAVAVKAATHLQVIGNRMTGYTDQAGISLVKGSEDTLFENNVILDGIRGIDIHAEEDRQPRGLTVRNNMIVNVAEYGIQVIGVNNGQFVHNTIVQAKGNALKIVTDGLTNGVIRNNLIVQSGLAVMRSTVFQNVTVGYNGWFDTSADSALRASTDKTGSGDPGFVNLADRDLHLTANSRVRDIGLNVGVTTDFEGDPRPSGCCPDLGADEYKLAVTATAIPTVAPTKIPTLIKTPTPIMTLAPTATALPTNTPPAPVTVTPMPTSTEIGLPAAGNNLVLNPGFESGTAPWVFYVDKSRGAGSFNVVQLADAGSLAAEIKVTNYTPPDTNIQLHQKDLTLEAGREYRVEFFAKSSTGHNVTLSLLKHASPYTNYGLKKEIDLTSTWQKFSLTFQASGFSNTANDVRLMFLFAKYAAAGDVYYFDQISLTPVQP